MIANYHTHTWRSNHAEPNERAYIERAIAGGIKTLGFSDHTPYPLPYRELPLFRMPLERLEDYVVTILKLKKEYAPDIEIHLGLEAEFYPDYFDRLQEILRQYPMEYLLLGQHFTCNELDGVYSGAATESVETLHTYCSQAIRAMETGYFTYFAHPDLIHFVGDRSVYQKEMRRICVAAKRMGIPLEINFLGLMEGRNYPNPAFWEVAGQEGNDVIFGCDAHRAKFTWAPDAEELATEKYVERFGLHLVQTVTLRKPF